MTLPIMLVINLIIIVALGLVARLVKVGSEHEKGGWNFKFTTRDLILLAVIGAISGVVNTGTGILWNGANAAGGPLAGAALQGAFMWGYLLAFFLVRKPGSMLIVGLLETAIEALLATPPVSPRLVGASPRAWVQKRSWPSAIMATSAGWALDWPAPPRHSSERSGRPTCSVGIAPRQWCNSIGLPLPSCWFRASSSPDCWAGGWVR